MKRIACYASLVALLCGFSPVSALKNEEGNRYYRKGQIGRAKTAYERALKRNAESPEIAFNLGNAYYKEEAFKDSLGAYKKAAEPQKSLDLQSKSFYNLGNALFRSQDTVKAAEFYKQALRLNPKDEDAKYNLELLTKKEDQKKQQQDKQNQKQEQQQGQGGGQGEQKPEDQKPEGGGQDQQGQGGEQTERGEQEKKEQQDTQGGQDGEEQQQPEPEEEPLTQKAKSYAQMRADQILNALDNQEKQAMRLQFSNQPPQRMKRSTEKDW